MRNADGKEGQAIPELEDFAGRWHLARRIEDRRGAMTGRLEGEAVFAWDGAALVLTETGQLRYGTAAPMRTTRQFIWRAQGQGIAVFFADGRPFHRISAASPSAHHDCAPDRYEVRYDFGEWPLWRATWRVTGPRKDYVMTTGYEKAETGEAFSRCYMNT